MPAPKSTKRRSQVQTNREMRDLSVAKILDAALTLFVKNGYASTTMDQIALAADMTKGGVYFYFDKKETILLRLIDDINSRYFDHFFQMHSASTGSFKERLVKLIHWQVTYGETHPRELMLIILVSIEISDLFEEAAKRVTSMYDMLHKYVSFLVDEGKRSGEFKTSFGSKEYAGFFVAAHDGMMLEWYRRSRELDGSKLVRVYRELLLLGLQLER